MVSSVSDYPLAALSSYPVENLASREWSLPHYIYVAMDLLVTNIFAQLSRFFLQAGWSISKFVEALEVVRSKDQRSEIRGRRSEVRKLGAFYFLLLAVNGLPFTIYYLNDLNDLDGFNEFNGLNDFNKNLCHTCKKEFL